MKKKLLALIMAICMLCTLLPFGALADSSTETVTIKVSYKQTEARSMLTMINDFRTGSDAWAWNSDNSQKVYNNNLKKLTYDYSLEKIAMQRAAEIAVNFDHTRPNGNGCFTAYNVNYSSAGENIAAGYADVKAAFVGWQEKNDKYAGQGHRRNMLGSGFNAVGIACVSFNGYNYWVQEFGYVSTPDTNKTNANDSDSNVNLEISKDLLSSASLSSSVDSSISLVVGKTAELPKLTAKIKMDNTWPSGTCKVTPKNSWTSADTSVAKISDGKLVGVSAGSTTIKASALGKTVKITVNVADHAHNYKDGLCTICGELDPNYSLAAPTSLTASSDSISGSPKLKWNAVDGAVKYYVYRSASKSSGYKYIGTAKTTSYKDSSADAGSKYYYRVRAVNAGGIKSDPSNIIARTCDCAKPAVTASNTASTGLIKLKWSTIDGAEKYYVYRASSKSGDYTKIASTTSTSYTDKAAKAGKKYYYKVKAICDNSSANSAYCTAVARTCDCARPDVSIKLSSGHPKLSWDIVSGASEYYVYRSTSQEGTYSKISSTTGTSYTDKTATAGETYYYKVKAINTNSSANSAYSSADYVKAE